MCLSFYVSMTLSYFTLRLVTWILSSVHHLNLRYLGSALVLICFVWCEEKAWRRCALVNTSPVFSCPYFLICILSFLPLGAELRCERSPQCVFLNAGFRELQANV